MKLRQIVVDKTYLTLTKEKKIIKYGEIFEVDDTRVEQILSARFKNKPVAELLGDEEPTENEKQDEESTENEEQPRDEESTENEESSEDEEQPRDEETSEDEDRVDDLGNNKMEHQIIDNNVNEEKDNKKKNKDK